jgi:hypothetical protein
MTRWYRAYEGTVTDAKLGEAALIAGCSRSVAIAAWHCLLESAAVRNNCGSFDATPRRVAVILCEPPAQIETLFAAFEEIGLIGDGAVRAWKRRQFQSDDSKARVAKHRAKKRQETANVTAGNGDVTPPYTDTDTEISEPKGSSPRAWALPAGVSLQVWQDFLSNRKRKRLGNTPTAWKAFQDDLNRVSSRTGIPPPKLIEHAAAKGWGSINDPNEDQRNGRSEPASKIQATLDILGRGNQRPGDDRRAAGLPHPSSAFQP